jgi:hypothetical protein
MEITFPRSQLRSQKEEEHRKISQESSLKWQENSLSKARGRYEAEKTKFLLTPAHQNMCRLG